MSPKPIPTIDYDREAERKDEAVESLNDRMSPLRWSVSSPPITTATPEIETVAGPDPTNSVHRPRRHSSDSDGSVLMLSPQRIQGNPVDNFLLPPTRQHLQTPPPPKNVVVPPGMGLGEHCNIPYGLRPTEHDTHHAPHPLDGPRHTPRCGIADNDDFARHCSERGKWLIDRTPDPHTTVKIGHGPGMAFRFFEAEFLNFPGVTAIKIVIPLCATQLRSLDWDVVRAVALHLRQYVGKRAVCISNRNGAVQEAEQLSLKFVEFELQSRSWERRKAAEDFGDLEASEAGNGSSIDSHPPTPLRYENPSFLSETRLAPVMPIASERTGRPEFNTRRTNRRGVAEVEAHKLTFPINQDQHSEGSLIHGHPAGNSCTPRTESYPPHDFHGANFDGSSVCEQNSTPSRASRSQFRVEDESDETLGVNYGCMGHEGWY